MMKHSRKFLAWLLVALMTFALMAGGCGGSDNDSGGSSGTTSEEVAQEDGDVTGRNNGFDDWEDLMTLKDMIAGTWRIGSSNAEMITDNENWKFFYVSFSYEPMFLLLRFSADDEGKLNVSYQHPTTREYLPLYDNPLTCEFEYYNYGRNTTGQLILIKPGIYEQATNFSFFMKEKNEDNSVDTYSIMFDEDNMNKVTFYHWHQDLNGTDLSNYQVSFKMTRTGK